MAVPHMEWLVVEDQEVAVDRTKHGRARVKRRRVLRFLLLATESRLPWLVRFARVGGGWRVPGSGSVPESQQQGRGARFAPGAIVSRHSARLHYAGDPNPVQRVHRDHGVVFGGRGAHLDWRAARKPTCPGGSTADLRLGGH